MPEQHGQKRRTTAHERNLEQQIEKFMVSADQRDSLDRGRDNQHNAMKL